MTLFSLTGFTKVYSGRTVLDIEGLEIAERSICALLGPNGAGKTTLMNILGFLDRPSTGEVYYRSRRVNFVESALQSLRREVVMVDQFPILFSTTVFKNMEFGLKIRGISKPERGRIIDEALDLVGMREFSAARANRLSGGETQRVAIARALALSPRVFLCDEPTSSVDSENQAVILNILKQIHESKRITILFTTHDRLQAVALASRPLMLDKGRLIESGCENIFSASVDSGPGGENRYVIYPDVILELPDETRPPTNGRVRIFIDSDRILLCPPGKIPDPKNTLKGRVRQVTRDFSKIRVLVEAGASFILTISEDEYRNRQLLVGDPVDFSIPPEAIQRIG